MHLQAEFGFAAHWRYKEGDCQHSSFVLRMVEWARYVVTWHCETMNKDSSSAQCADSLKPACKFPIHADDCPYCYKPHSGQDGPAFVIMIENDEVLGVERTTSQQEIKKAYYKLALRLHPDKNPGDEEAKEKFQQLQKVISILGDEEKRALYDQTGCVDDADLAGEVVQNLHEYFRAVYKKVTEADIEEFEANYRGSDYERNDLIDLYKKYKGNMNRLFCSMLCLDPKLDSHRFKDILDELIAAV
ncbi:hypothetical protein QN277_024045 [Acacia crassicarpa]|uniref:J domain-containing protein n=1 Tax=Acacia crassicarpa TaxID=499986 RepID=A0AAE1JFR5_9FABA|nr:hypothetical protein QN277_024045 [Acacia crassicarpa]